MEKMAYNCMNDGLAEKDGSNYYKYIIESGTQFTNKHKKNKSKRKDRNTRVCKNRRKKLITKTVEQAADEKVEIDSKRYQAKKAAAQKLVFLNNFSNVVKSLKMAISQWFEKNNSRGGSIEMLLEKNRLQILTPFLSKLGVSSIAQLKFRDEKIFEYRFSKHLLQKGTDKEDIQKLEDFCQRLTPYLPSLNKLIEPGSKEEGLAVDVVNHLEKFLETVIAFTRNSKEALIILKKNFNEYKIKEICILSVISRSWISCLSRKYRQKTLLVHCINVRKKLRIHLKKKKNL
ncbi:hypothetical protein RFI_03114 [Reticulomyxa filosa]|uniref:Uncharacterized protein n=1 Tax=Reticulomyxa filosa TaxID=46433 RepID=X6P8K7_RETFI|nr:hypothetical protein RFI_03114 [Reticulomyxa filosa]|eukprot:ETO33982.1 hypothetical protein RFI_03114 [Reticulomyxa filosa]